MVHGCGEESPKRIEDVAQGYSITLPDKWEERRYTVGPNQYRYYFYPRNQRRERRHERLAVGRRENPNNDPAITWTESNGYSYYDYVRKGEPPDDPTTYNRLIHCGENWFHIQYVTYDSRLVEKDSIALSDLPDSVIRSIQSFECSAEGPDGETGVELTKEAEIVTGTLNDTTSQNQTPSHDE